jgi:carbon-monoxide dehydrogenase medium subunit
MKPPRFSYHDPATVEEALGLLAAHGDAARVLAGGQSLMPMLNFRLARPGHLIDVNRVAALATVSPGPDRGLRIGALVRQRTLERSPLIRERCPMIGQAMPFVGHPQIRARGTLGGSLAHADPAADYPAALLALDAEIVVASTADARTIPARDFFVDMMTTQLRPGEILTQVRVPPRESRTGGAYAKLHQPASGFAIVGVAARLTLGKGNKIEQVAVGVTGLGPKPFRATAVERALAGKAASPKLIAEAARHAADGIEPLSDLHASRDYRREMAVVFARRALERAVARAAGRDKAGT